ncbi:hypothetical protein [Tenacibaculum sp. 190524A05c]|uniref:hypothetical protein n=1 Tax=Tenacibaculum platacis TaxID=3137852 RepID=UPI0032B212D4
MKNKTLFYSLIFIFLFSCKPEQVEINELNNMLNENLKFNERVLNIFRGQYYQLASEKPARKIKNLDELDVKFDSLISLIDNAIITNTKNNYEKIILLSNEVLTKTHKIANYKTNTLSFKLDETKDGLHKLKLLKGKLVLAMANTFEYACNIPCDLSIIRKVEIDSIISKHTNQGTNLTLTSKYGQSIKENRRIIINKIEHNGKEKKLDYTLNKNYSMVDIEFNSLEKGTYVIDGIFRVYTKDVNIDIPFNKKAIVE